MKVERKVYNEWAFTEHAQEKGRINFEIYKELVNKYAVLFGTPQNEDDFDVVVQRERGYNHSLYTVIKNKPNLSDDELMLIFDGGNLCFGGQKISDNLYRVNED